MNAVPDTIRTPQLALRSLLPYLGGLVLACLSLQILIAATGGGIGILAGIGTAVIALAALVYVLSFVRPLGQLRFGLVLAHALLYVCVTGSFAAHALISGTLGSGIDPSWGGVLVAMPGCWSIGLIIHAVGALMGRGFESARA